MCWSNLRPASIVTPRSLTLSDEYKVFPFISMQFFYQVWFKGASSGT